MDLVQSSDNLTAMPLESVGQLLVEIGRQYLAHGGPISRLEERLTSVGQKLGYDAQVFAAPTGIFVTVAHSDGRVITLMGRVKIGEFNYGIVLYVESVIDQLLNAAKANPPQLQISPFYQEPYWMQNLGTFLLGSAASFSQYQLLWPALFSGALTTMIARLSGPMAKKWRFSSIFCDFFSTFLALMVGAVLFSLFGVPVPAVVIGVLILLVPGVTITNSISELAENNFISGTSKLVKGILVVMAMGVATLLAKDLLFVFGYELKESVRPSQLPMWGGALASSLMVYGFALVFHIPRRFWGYAILTGLIGWCSFRLGSRPELLVLSILGPAFLVGVISLMLGRILKTPSQIFSVPGIISMVPGMLAFSTFYDPASSGGEVGFRVAVIGSSITFGLLSARIPFLLMGSRTAHNVSV